MKSLKVLKMQRTKLLNKPIESYEEFEEMQDKLNEIELEIAEVLNNE